MSAVLDQSSRTFIGSVVFVDIIGYSKRTVSEQITFKDRFTALLSAALADVAPDQRLILDTGDGAALSFLGDPEDALFVSMHLRDMVKKSGDIEPAADGVELPDEPLPLRIGINLGPVKLVRDINGHPNIVGDGINVAQRIMGFANEGQIVVSRSFFDVVSVISDEYAKLFRYEGSRTDKHIREHEIYVVGESEAAFDKVREGFETRAAMSSTNSFASYPGGNRTGEFEGDGAGAAATPLLQDRRKLTVIGGALGAVVLFLLIAVVLKRPVEKPAETVSPPGPAKTASAQPATPPPDAVATTPGAVPATAIAPDAAKPADAAQAVVPAGGKPDSPAKPETKSDAKPEAKPEGKSDSKGDPKAVLVLGTVNLQINPWGEVVVNGKVIGVSPPLKQHKLPPGKYKIEVRNSTFAPHVANIEVKAKEEVVVRHTFR